MHRVWLWWSSGKDSAWSLHLLRQDPSLSVQRIITTVTPRFGRVAIHGTRIALLQAQAAAVGVPLQLVQLPYPCSNSQYEAAVQPVLEEAATAEMDHMAFGDIFLEDVRAYRERLLSGSGIEPLFPLWGMETARLSRLIVDSGVEAVVTCVDPQQLDRAFAGRSFDAAFLDSLPESVDACGENGEFHTFVTDGPMFGHGLKVQTGEVVEREGFVYADVIRCE